MADADLITYESEDEAALNDVYDNLGSEEVESSDGLPTEPEEVRYGNRNVAALLLFCDAYITDM